MELVKSIPMWNLLFQITQNEITVRRYLTIVFILTYNDDSHSVKAWENNRVLSGFYMV